MLNYFVNHFFCSTEGCNNSKPPQRSFYTNLFANKNLTTIPNTYVTRMKQFVNSVSTMIVQDYPPTYPGEYEPFVYWGTAGRAAMALRLFRDTQDAVWLNRAKQFVDVALQQVKPYNYTGFAFAFQKGRTGIVSVAAVVYDMLGLSSSDFVDEVNWVFDQVQDGDYYDWESGMAGLVYAADYLNLYFQRQVVPNAKILRVLHLIYRAGMKYYNATTGAMQFEYYMQHFWTGMGSHGSGSPIYSLLLHKDLLQNDTILKHVQSTIDYYVSIQTSDGQIPGDLSPNRTQWCHGIPGLLGPFGLAYQAFGDKKFYNAGVLGSRLISEIGILSKGMQFCHGVGGNIYMMLDFYKQTKDPQVLSLAISMIMTALDTAELTDPSAWKSYDCLPDGMFVSSSIGAVLLFSDIVRNSEHLENVQMVSFHLSI